MKIAPLAVLLTLAACGGPTRTAQLGECEMAAQRSVKGGTDPVLERRAYIESCMKAHDYEFKLTDPKNPEKICGGEIWLAYSEPKCFEKRPFWARLAD